MYRQDSFWRLLVQQAQGNRPCAIPSMDPYRACLAEILKVKSRLPDWINLTWQYWVPTWPYWVGVDTVTIVMSTVVGVGILTGLRKARLIQAADFVPSA